MKMYHTAVLAIVGAALTASPGGAEQALSGSAPAIEKTIPPSPLSEWQDLKYGLFVHWGPCSVAGVEIGWGRKAPRAGNATDWYPAKVVPGDVYDNLYKKFNPVKFDADQWVKTVKMAGMKYIVLTAKHVDGFMLWDTNTSTYNITNTPYGKDICKEIADACHEHGVKLGWYYAPCDWYDPDCRHPTRNAIYVKRMQAQLRELLTNYGKVDILWFDSDGGTASWGQDATYAMIRKLQPGIVINDRLDRQRPGRNWRHRGDYKTFENHLGTWNPSAHESCISMIHGQWAWTPDAKLYSATDGANLLVRSLINNGNLLYNVGPMPTGEIEDRQLERLLNTGKWLRQVGEAVYGTRGGPVPGGAWGGTTNKGNNVYLFLPDKTVNDWAKGKPYGLSPLDKKLVAVKCLTGERVSATQASNRMTLIDLPDTTRKRQDGEANYIVIKLTYDGPPKLLTH